MEQDLSGSNQRLSIFNHHQWHHKCTNKAVWRIQADNYNVREVLHRWFCCKEGEYQDNLGCCIYRTINAINSSDNSTGVDGIWPYKGKETLFHGYLFSWYLLSGNTCRLVDDLTEVNVSTKEREWINDWCREMFL